MTALAVLFYALMTIGAVAGVGSICMVLGDALAREWRVHHHLK